MTVFEVWRGETSFPQSNGGRGLGNSPSGARPAFEPAACAASRENPGGKKTAVA
jgi:hypothetical protein